MPCRVEIGSKADGQLAELDAALRSIAVSETYADPIAFDPKQCGGRAWIRRYGIPVKDVLDPLAAGGPKVETQEDYDFLRKPSSLILP
ncbi:MAG: DUF433 domain-containing protein [Verrucomicrobiota bacterium]|jgi:uncharacterized protein (DUF433 family)